MFPVDRAAADDCGFDDLTNGWFFGLWEVGLLTAALIARKRIGERTRGSFPDAALYPCERFECPSDGRQVVRLSRHVASAGWWHADLAKNRIAGSSQICSG